MPLLQISREQIDSIKARVDIAAVIAERGIRLERRGRTLFALCPFHKEKTASLGVSSERGLFHCFGCGTSGDVIGFVVRHDHVTFPEAVRLLAVRAGVELATDAAAPCADIVGRKSWR